MPPRGRALRALFTESFPIFGGSGTFKEAGEGDGMGGRFKEGSFLWPRLALSRISFRRQILLLGIVAVVLLLAVIFASFAALQYTRSTVLRDEQRRLSEATSALVRAYNKSEMDRTTKRPSLLESSRSQPSQEALTELSRGVLQNAGDVAGGFYTVDGDNLVGYSFPTGASGRPRGESVTEDERPLLLRAAREAAITHTLVEEVLSTGPDISVISAAPLRDGQRLSGSAWTTRLLRSIPGTNRLRTYLIAVGLGIAALACVVLTLFVVRGLQDGVRKIEEGLKNLEQSLASQIPIDSDPDEIRQIAQAINRLGTTLKDKIESEKLIEDRLRHAERLAALGRLIAGVAHEVRNPLATIRLRVQMCQDSGSAEVHESCAIALEEIERLNGMVNRLLSFSRPVRLQLEPTDLNRVVQQRLDYFAEIARRHDVRFVTQYGRGPNMVRADQSRLAQVFDNVIQNAIDAMSHTGGTLCVNVTCEGMTAGNGFDAYVEFSDTGEGMRSEVVGRIFDPFFTTKSSGTGLGLSISHELMQAHGGEIQVASAEGCGTTVRILFPTRERQAFAHLDMSAD
jgi:signal transduction histidine kinase